MAKQKSNGNYGTTHNVNGYWVKWSRNRRLPQGPSLAPLTSHSSHCSRAPVRSFVRSLTYELMENRCSSMAWTSRFLSVSTHCAQCAVCSNSTMRILGIQYNSLCNHKSNCWKLRHAHSELLAQAAYQEGNSGNCGPFMHAISSQNITLITKTFGL